MWWAISLLIKNVSQSRDVSSAPVEDRRMEELRAHGQIIARYCKARVFPSTPLTCRHPVFLQIACHPLQTAELKEDDYVKEGTSKQWWFLGTECWHQLLSATPAVRFWSKGSKMGRFRRLTGWLGRAQRKLTRGWALTKDISQDRRSVCFTWGKLERNLLALRPPFPSEDRKPFRVEELQEDTHSTIQNLMAITLFVLVSLLSVSHTSRGYSCFKKVPGVAYIGCRLWSPCLVDLAGMSDTVETFYPSATVRPKILSSSDSHLYRSHGVREDKLQWDPELYSYMHHETVTTEF